jgi:hypothetical protein
MGEICVYNQDGESLAITLNRLKHLSIRNATLLIALHDGLPTASTTERGIRVDVGSRNGLDSKHNRTRLPVAEVLNERLCGGLYRKKAKLSWILP